MNEALKRLVWDRAQSACEYCRLPQSLDVRTWSLLPEPGVNLDLYQTLEAVYRDREHVTMWGPFRIHQVVYVENR